MKKMLVRTALLTSMIIPQAFATVEFKNIPLEKAWGIVCTMVDKHGHGLTDYQVTTYTMNKKPILMIKYLDSTLGDNLANVVLTSIESAEGGGNDLAEYSGKIKKGSLGNMFKGSSELSIIVDFNSPLLGIPNTFKSTMLLDKYKEVKYPTWVKNRSLYCTMVPQA